MFFSFYTKFVSLSTQSFYFIHLKPTVYKISTNAIHILLLSYVFLIKNQIFPDLFIDFCLAQIKDIKSPVLFSERFYKYVGNSILYKLQILTFLDDKKLPMICEIDTRHAVLKVFVSFAIAFFKFHDSECEMK